MADADPLALVGTTIAGKYAIESVVGSGGFAIVYRARHQLWKRPVAVKVFKALGDVPEADRAKLLEEFVREGALLAELSERSAAIVQARDVGTITTARGEELPYMVLEWLEGATLEAVLGDEKAKGMAPRTLEETMRLLDPVAEALALAHARGIAHRDVKPANVFVLGDPRAASPAVKLLDFGIAKVVQDAQKMAGAFSKTAGQITSFTPSYGAPEQFNRLYGATGPWTDVFALALLVAEVLSGREALEGNDLMQLAFASADKARRPTPRACGATVPDAIERVLARAVAVAPSERQQDAGALWTELRAAALGDPVSSSPGTDATLPAPVVVAGPPSGAAGLGHAETLMGPASSNAVSARLVAGASAPEKARLPVVRILVGAVAVVAAGAGAFALMEKRAPSASPAPMGSAPLTTASAATPATEPCPRGMTRIPGGMYFMGSDERDAVDNEKPAHQVTLAPYCIDTFEVTARRYNTCREVGGCKKATFNDWPGMSEHERGVYDPLCTAAAGDKLAEHPVNCVDWEMAQRYCQAQGMRLPTEAEWEFAARGPDGRKYPWGDDAPSAKLLNACGTECVAWGAAHGVKLEAMYPEDDLWANTAPVGSFHDGRSRYGVEDVVGNVWEWTADWYAPYATAVLADPKGPATGTERVVRGGAWNGIMPSWVRPTFRFKDDPKKRSFGVGFRCARAL